MCEGRGSPGSLSCVFPKSLLSQYVQSASPHLLDGFRPISRLEVGTLRCAEAEHLSCQVAMWACTLAPHTWDPEEALWGWKSVSGGNGGREHH